MIRLSRQPGILMWALVAFLVPLFCYAQDVFNMDIIYGFFPENGLPPEDPTIPQLEALVCETQIFLSQVMQQSINNPTVTMQANQIDYVRGMGEANSQFLMTFWGDFNTAEGGNLPTEAEIVEAFAQPGNPNFDATAYLNEHVQQATPLNGDPLYFANVNSMEYNGSFGVARPGILEQAVCEETIAPTFPGDNVTVAGNDTATPPPAGNGTTTPPPTGNGTATDPPGVNGTATPPPGGVNGTDPSGNATMPPGVNGTDPLGNATMPPGVNGTDPNATMPPGGNETSGPLANGTATRAPTLAPGETLPPTAPGATLAPTAPGETRAPTSPGATLVPTVPGATLAPTAPGETRAPTAPGATVAPTTLSPTAPGETRAPTAPAPAPDGGTGVVPVPATPAPTPMASAPDTEDLVYFTLEYGFEGGQERNPTTEEVQNLICVTNLFYRDQLRNFTGDDTIQVEATNIDWSYNSEGILPVMVAFTANATMNDYEDIVPKQTVWDGMQVTTPDIERYIQLYVWNTTPDDNLFQFTDSANFTNEVNIPVPIGRLPTYYCPATEAPSAMPTTSPAPTSSAAPSGMPTSSASPTISKSPSFAPSISLSPSATPTAAPTPTEFLPIPPPVDGGPTAPTPPPQPTISPMPTVSAQPTNSPTVSAAPTITPMPTTPGITGPVTRQQIKTKYYVSNEDDITDATQVNNSGLTAAWPAFSDEVVQNITAARNRRRLRAGGRRLQVLLEPNSATIDEIDEVDCPEGSVDSATCHNVTSSYVLLLQEDEDPVAVEQEYGTQTIAAVDDGSYQAVLDREDPDSPLTIGIIPKPKSDGGMPLWLLILIILLCVLCCCCILFALFYLMQNRDKEDKALEPYDEEGFVYDFLIPPNEKPQTEVDDDATKAVDLDDDDDEDDDKEEFNDEDEDKEEFDEDSDKEDDDDDDDPQAAAKNAAAAAPPDESVALIEAESFDDDDDKDSDDDNDDEKQENWEDEKELDSDDDDNAARKVEPVDLDDDDDDDDEGDEMTPLVPVAEEQEAPPQQDDSDEDEEEEPLALKPDPLQEFGEQDEPDGMRAASLEDIDDDTDELKMEQEANTIMLEHAENMNNMANDLQNQPPPDPEEAFEDDSDGAGKADPDEDWDDEPPTDTETAQSMSKDSGGGAETDEEAWDDEDEPAPLPEATNEQQDMAASSGDEDDGDWEDGGDVEGGADEEWDDDDGGNVGGGDEEGWEDDGEGADEEGWEDEADDKNDKAPAKK